MNLCMLAFADKYEVPAIIPQKFGFRWWEFVLGQGSLLSSIATSFVLAAIVTAVSLLICIPAAYALARYNFKGKRVFLLSFLLSNAYPRMGLYISIGILFYRLNLMGTFVGVIIIHVLNSMMFMTWIPSGASGACTDSRRNRQGRRGRPLPDIFPDHASVSHAGHCRCQCVHLPGIPGGGPGNAAGGLPQVKTMPVELYGVIMEYPLTAGPVLSLILIIPIRAILFLMRKYINADNLSQGYGMK